LVSRLRIEKTALIEAGASTPALLIPSRVNITNRVQIVVKTNIKK
jgi:hypothetical protein